MYNMGLLTLSVQKVQNSPVGPLSVRFCPKYAVTPFMDKNLIQNLRCICIMYDITQFS
jgi:hypothetical protein